MKLEHIDVCDEFMTEFSSGLAIVSVWGENRLKVNDNYYEFLEYNFHGDTNLSAIVKTDKNNGVKMKEENTVSLCILNDFHDDGFVGVELIEGDGESRYFLGGTRVVHYGDSLIGTDFVFEYK